MIDLTGGEIDRQVTAQVVAVQERALDEVSHVPQRDHEVAKPVTTEVLHDVPQDRHAADLDHGLGSRHRLFL